jgi:hypothetical protein
MVSEDSHNYIAVYVWCVFVILNDCNTCNINTLYRSGDHDSHIQLIDLAVRTMLKLTSLIIEKKTFTASHYRRLCWLCCYCPPTDITGHDGDSKYSLNHSSLIIRCPEYSSHLIVWLRFHEHYAFIVYTQAICRLLWSGYAGCIYCIRHEPTC